MGVLLVAAGLMLAPLAAGARVGVYIGVAPPAPVVETLPVAPGPGYVWQGGYYNWDGARSTCGCPAPTWWARIQAPSGWPDIMRTTVAAGITGSRAHWR